MIRCMGCMGEMQDHEQVCKACGYDRNEKVKQSYYLLPETVVGDRYIVGKALGCGGFGVTYIGWDRALERKVAIKEYLPSGLATRSYGAKRLTIKSGEAGEQYRKGLGKFMLESQILANVENVPEIVDIYDVFYGNDSGYIVMEYLEGKTVEQILEEMEKEGRKMPVDQALEIVKAVLRGLSEVHKAGIIHRDIAPDNIFITKKNEVKLLDFGAARHESTGQSRTLSVIIKYGYAPVEQYSKKGEQGSWTDMYALGATFYRMITGETLEQSIYRKPDEPLKKPSEFGIEIAPEVENTILRSLQIKKDDRIQNAEEFLQALEGKINVEMQPEPVRISGWVKAAGASCAVICLCMAIFFSVNFSDRWEVPVDDGVVLNENEIYVPNVAGMKYDEAKQLLEEKNLRVVISGMNYSDTIEKDRILRQDPKDGEKVELEETVYIVMSGGDEEVMMPDLSGLTYQEAVDKIEKQNLILAEEEIGQEYSEFVEKGKVIAQSIEAEKRIEVETEVSFTISRGKISEETAVLKIPDLVGMTYDEALKYLSQLKQKEGFTYTIGETEKRNDAKVKKNRIAVQEPKAGSRARTDKPIRIVISKGPKMVQVPKLKNLTQEKAVKQLKRENLKADITTDYSNSVVEGKVISQDKEPGAKIAEESTVMIVVSKGKAPAAPQGAGNSSGGSGGTSQGSSGGSTGGSSQGSSGGSTGGSSQGSSGGSTGGTSQGSTSQGSSSGSTSQSGSTGGSSQGGSSAGQQPSAPSEPEPDIVLPPEDTINFY